MKNTKILKCITLLLVLITAVFMLGGCSYIEKIEEALSPAEITDENSAETEERIKNDGYPESGGGRLKVHFIDIGQGDSQLIEFPDGKNMLIDAGEIGKGDTVVSYIKNIGYDRINYVVATHPHSDHIGGMTDVLNAFSVDSFYMPEASTDTNCFLNMLEALEKNGCSAEYITAGKILAEDLSLGYSVTAVGPVKAYDDLNNSSAVLRLEYKDSSFLFTGDAEIEAEDDILASGADVKADVLKVGHHGSYTSTSARFLSSVLPVYGVISSEKGNSYGHPHRETLAALENRGVEIYRTDLSGTIVIETDGSEYIVKPSGDGSDGGMQAEYDESLSANGNNADIQVYKTKTGECYHMDGCDGLKRSRYLTTVKDARLEGLRPCPNCNPPE